MKKLLLLALLVPSLAWAEESCDPQVFDCSRFYRRQIEEREVQEEQMRRDLADIAKSQRELVQQQREDSEREARNDFYRNTYGQNLSPGQRSLLEELP